MASIREEPRVSALYALTLPSRSIMCGIHGQAGLSYLTRLVSGVISPDKLLCNPVRPMSLASDRVVSVRTNQFRVLCWEKQCVYS